MATFTVKNFHKEVAAKVEGLSKHSYRNLLPENVGETVMFVPDKGTLITYAQADYLLLSLGLTYEGSSVLELKKFARASNEAGFSNGGVITTQVSFGEALTGNREEEVKGESLGEKLSHWSTGGNSTLYMLDEMLKNGFYSIIISRASEDSALIMFHSDYGITLVECHEYNGKTFKAFFSVDKGVTKKNVKESFVWVSEHSSLFDYNISQEGAVQEKKNNIHYKGLVGPHYSAAGRPLPLSTPVPEFIHKIIQDLDLDKRLDKKVRDFKFRNKKLGSLSGTYEIEAFLSGLLFDIENLANESMNLPPLPQISASSEKIKESVVSYPVAEELKLITPPSLVTDNRITLSELRQCIEESAVNLTQVQVNTIFGKLVTELDKRNQIR